MVNETCERVKDRLSHLAEILIIEFFNDLTTINEWRKEFINTIVHVRKNGVHYFILF